MYDSSFFNSMRMKLPCPKTAMRPLPVASELPRYFSAYVIQLRSDHVSVSQSPYEY